MNKGVLEVLEVLEKGRLISKNQTLYEFPGQFQFFAVLAHRG